MKNKLIIMGTICIFVLIASVLLLLVPQQTALSVSDAHSSTPPSSEQISQVSIGASLDLQEKCAKQAHEEFRRLGWKEQQATDIGVSQADYTNHYNGHLNRCLVVIEITSTTGNTIWTTKTLSDAFEGKTYGDYLWHTDQVKKYWEVPPVTCSVTLPSGEEKACHSEAEFSDLVKIYMQ